MHVSRLIIEDLRAIEHLEVDLSSGGGEPRRRVVFLGVNGAGKTTVLDAIVHVFGCLAEHPEMGGALLGAAEIRNADDPGIKPNAALRRAKITVDAVLSDEERRSIRRLRGRPPAAGTLTYHVGQTSDQVDFDVEDSGRLGDLPHDDESLAGDVGAVEAEGLGFSLAARAAVAEQRPACLMFPADRGILTYNSDVRIGQMAELDPRSDCLSRSRERFFALAPRLALASGATKSEEGRRVARMWKVVEKYFPEMPRVEGTDGLMLRFRNKGGALVRLNSLSDGERAVLLLLGELAFRAPKYGMVLIDEIEQHIHPRWQRQILQALLALVPSAQFVITTQSPYLAACAPDDVIKLGEWDSDGH